jgi:hypothetical protein
MDGITSIAFFGDYAMEILSARNGDGSRVVHVTVTVAKTGSVEHYSMVDVSGAGKKRPASSPLPSSR